MLKIVSMTTHYGHHIAQSHYSMGKPLLLTTSQSKSLQELKPLSNLAKYYVTAVVRLIVELDRTVPHRTLIVICNDSLRWVYLAAESVESQDCLVLSAHDCNPVARLHRSGLYCRYQLTFTQKSGPEALVMKDL